ncbi:MAG TPA: DUF2225 domain-containing protein [Leptospiraceae bacterium]|nr:DUF2225 domain-containing protein [Leptospiraceae bacterium]HMY67757.1 DUF2225 domain-containing protein [Leptospiraceae bacterium]HMZ58688.1 DUF2225 domain-containing protein [Leptospiraceae bacterium]HNF27928.1 DUF2225 domain-containing protein [Leptospiraceae bacterium]HNM03168.1 DUF2225 domain-containing protein [Leptospiraceae bacterium]
MKQDSAALQTKKASFRAKENTVCPICNHTFQREQMFQGGGRLIAGNLTKELRRLYQKNKKFGRINPNDYLMVTCSRCLYTAYPRDWPSLNLTEIERLKQYSNDRKLNLEKILGPIDFNQERNLISGAGSFLLAIDCYQHRAPGVAPTPKKAVCALKAAWYFDDLALEFPHLPYDKVRDFLYRKACMWYSSTLEIMQTGVEPADVAASILGPDTDNNWGFDGVIYLNAYLSLKFKDQITDDPEKRLNILVRAKRMLAKLYGSGKSSKSKPSVLLDIARELYDELGGIIESMGGEK